LHKRYRGFLEWAELSATAMKKPHHFDGDATVHDKIRRYVTVGFIHKIGKTEVSQVFLNMRLGRVHRSFSCLANV
jgi:hypothetical protein